MAFPDGGVHTIKFIFLMLTLTFVLVQMDLKTTFTSV